MASKCADLHGKVALVTGGAKGIGRGCVEILAENGWKVACWDIDDAEGTVVEDKYPERVFYRHCDVTDEEQIKNGIAATISKFGTLDCLVNNVGTQREYNTIDGYTTDNFRQLLEVNLIACFAMCKHSLPYLRKVKGNIVNISSIQVDHGSPQSVLYGASKAGIHTMTRCLAVDEAVNGVRVNAIAPGFIRTPLAERLFSTRGDVETLVEQTTKQCVLKRHGEPREIGKACLFLATDATYCTGSVLNATGGIEVSFGQKD